jgi:stage V sporulation protein B
MFVQGFATSLIGVVYFVVLARTLSNRPEDMGIYALLVFILALPQTLGTFALPSAAIKYVAQHLAENNRDKAKAVVTRVLQIGLLAGGVSFVLLFVPAEFVSALVFGSSEHALLLRFMAVCAIFIILFGIALSFLQGLQRMRESAALSLAYSIIHVGLGSYLLMLGWRLYAVVLSWLVGLIITSVLGLILTVKYLGFHSQLYPTRLLLNFSLPLYFSGSIGFFVSWVDQLVLASFTNLETLGVYFVAVRASVVPTLFSSAIVTTLLPQLSELYTRQGAGSLRDAFRVSSRYAVLIGFPLIVGVATLAYPTVILLAGVKYTDAAMPLMIISISALVGTLGIAVGPILLTLERTRVAALLSLVSVLTSVGFSYFVLAVLGWGMIGTAWARTLASIISVVLSLYVVSRYVPLAFDKEAIWKASAASAFMVLAIVGLDFVRRFMSSASDGFLAFRLHLLPVYVVAGALAYFVAVVALRAIKRQDLELIQEYLPSKFKWLGNWLSRIVRAD